MKRRLLDFIVCPSCGRDFSIKVFKEEELEIEAGLLLCSCGQFFPIINHIPRILMGELRKSIYHQFPDFFVKYKELLPVEGFKDIDYDKLQKKKTLKSFSYLWSKYPRNLNEWEKNFKFYFEPLGDINMLRDKTILDAGCGNGRHTYCASKYAKEIIAFDLSQSVDMAYHYNKDNHNVHFFQADIYNLPLRKNLFEFIFSIGVLHYLPFPEKGFKKLIGLLKEGSGILVYVYHSFPKTHLNFYLVKLTNFMRRFTTKMPHKLLYFLSYPVAVLSYLIFVIPYIILTKIFRIKRLTQTNWPLKLYSKYPFNVLINDTFDRFSPPLEHRYSKQEILDWYERKNLQEIKILGEGGWRIFGVKR